MQKDHKRIFETNWPTKKYKYHKQYCETIFRGINLKSKTLLDIGCGDGKFSLYAQCQGAYQITGLEPKDEGSDNVDLDKYKRIIKEEEIKNIELLEQTIEEYTTKKQFDIILLSDSINHLDEEACTKLTTSKEARKKYRILLNKIKGLLTKDGFIIVLDCSNRSFWSDIGLINPFAKTIEWEKHQTPEVWEKELKKIGLEKEETNWTIYHQIPELNLILDTKLAGYFANSHFRIVMRKK